MPNYPVLQHRSSKVFPKPFYYNVWSLTIMTISGDCPQGRSQHFIFPRRELLQRLASVALLWLVPRAQAVATPSGALPNAVNPSGALPKPEFAIGDLIASDWVDDDDDDAPDSATEFGEILGMRWLPEAESVWTVNTWVYFVRWTHSTIDAPSCYPCYDGEPSRGCDLRLVSHD